MDEPASNPNHSTAAAEARLRRMREELHTMEAAAIAGAFGAAVDAQELCAREGRPPPGWTIGCLASLAGGRQPVRRFGRAANPQQRHRQNIIHRIRFEAVTEIGEMHQIWREEDCGDPDGHGIEPLRKQLQWNAGFSEEESDRRAAEWRVRRNALWRQGTDLPDPDRGDRYKIAQELLQRTPAYVGRDGMEQSYELVRAAVRDGTFPGAYYLPTDLALHLIGWRDLEGVVEELFAPPSAKGAVRDWKRAGYRRTGVFRRDFGESS